MAMSFHLLVRSSLKSHCRHRKRPVILEHGVPDLPLSGQQLHAVGAFRGLPLAKRRS
jgi:hypothetical protein